MRPIHTFEHDLPLVLAVEHNCHAVLERACAGKHGERGVPRQQAAEQGRALDAFHHRAIVHDHRDGHLKEVGDRPGEMKTAAGDQGNRDALRRRVAERLPVGVRNPAAAVEQVPSMSIASSRIMVRRPCLLRRFLRPAHTGKAPPRAVAQSRARAQPARDPRKGTEAENPAREGAIDADVQRHRDAARGQIANDLRPVPGPAAHVVGGRRFELDRDRLGRPRVHAERIGKRGVWQLLDRREPILQQRNLLNPFHREGSDFLVSGT